MTDGDDKLTRRYREIPAEEPSAAIDAAIRAAAHGAVMPRRSTQRWAVPASLAAVLVLAVGVTHRMQQEVPGIEVAPPVSVSEYSTPPPAAEPAQPPLQAQRARTSKDEAAVAPAATSPAPAPTAKLSAPKDGREADAFQESRRDAAAPAPVVVEEKRKAVPEEAVAQKPQQAQQPKAFADTADRNVAAPAARAAPTPAAPARAAPAPATAAAPPPPERQEAAKTEVGRAAVDQASSGMAQSREKKQDAPAALAKETKGPLERELERIATLRREGRHAEADEALAKFRKDNPDYRIPEALWEQVKPR